MLRSLSFAENSPDAGATSIATRLDGAVRIFLGDLRTIDDLLCRPRLTVEKGVLASILANLSSAFDVLSEPLSCPSPAFACWQHLQLALDCLTRLADEICGNCVQHAYTPRLIFWMDRVQNSSRRIH
jgi:hypothetical protein